MDLIKTAVDCCSLLEEAEKERVIRELQCLKVPFKDIGNVDVSEALLKMFLLFLKAIILHCMLLLSSQLSFEKLVVIMDILRAKVCLTLKNII